MHSSAPLVSPAPAAPRRWVGATIVLVIGSLLALTGLAVMLVGGAALWANGQTRGSGFFQTPTVSVAADSFALVSPPMEVTTDVNDAVALPFDLGTLRLVAEAIDGNTPIFVGVGPQADVDEYLANVHHTVLTTVSAGPFGSRYRDVPGTVSPTLPGSQDFWELSSSGTGERQILWDLQTLTAANSANWTIVVMNADASENVAVQLTGGARSDLIAPIGWALLASGLIVLLIGVVLIVLGAVSLGRRTPRGPAASAAGPVLPAVTPDGFSRDTNFVAAPPSLAGDLVSGATDAAPRYPAQLRGTLDPALSRWLWLVKWVLVIPHLIVLFFLWIAFMVCTVVAGFGILFTGRYPRALFDFNVGVLRWTWRVSFYGYSALGTDQYPPFTLARTDYPADFEVAYPEQLSRGLVLVKWWLLAIPHLLIVAALTGGLIGWGSGWGNGAAGDGAWADGSNAGVSLLGLLVFIAGVILLFTGRFRQGLFDLILGINRWVFRVITYTALMRDEYPPFVLDQGAARP
ncbi:DUF4389 domain-containing protein [Cryobacterium frigoriphilum]|uniref:DUF4389 domain-containing protein n=1 Tax=Cryobacterium frigoriphilum TaxID=1259150 RepID=A0A4R9AA38_9MICO|nr:DUF4389 domain-containing protein [Cryobacterium frigoriphilum]TFD54575.1 DUF4389 domain-containing protein [Cryobacterium frigoriphilum]